MEDENLNLDLLNLIACSSLHLIIADPVTAEPIGYGSGCIVKYRDRYFLLSVAHVTNIPGAKTFIETNQENVENKVHIMPVGPMVYFDEFKLPNPYVLLTLEDMEELGSFFEKTIDITFTEIKEKTPLLQPEWDFIEFKIEKGEKKYLNLDLAGKPEKGKYFALCGRIRQDLKDGKLHSEPTFKFDMEYRVTIGRFHFFTTDEIITDKEDYEGCSGAPIIDEDGKLVGLAASVKENTSILCAFSIEECKRLLDYALEVGLV